MSLWPSGYWYPFRESATVIGAEGHATTAVLENFRTGTKFTDAVDLYVFDKKLRLLFIDALERIEVGLRVEIALLLGTRNPIAHRLPSELHGNFAKKVDPSTNQTKHDKWLARLDELTNKSREEFVQEYRKKYSTPLPIWMAIELWDFGSLSHFVNGMTNSDKAFIAAKYNMPSPEHLVSWVRNLNQLRNVCAHHSRLWNRVITDIPVRSKPNEVYELDHLYSDRHAETRVYASAAITQHFMKIINPKSDWAGRLKLHVINLPNVPAISIRHAGFPNGWDHLPLWS